MRRIVFAVMLVAWVVFGSTAFALKDYDPNGREWNGLERFSLIGDADGISIVPASEIDYAALTPSTPVILIYAKRDLDARNLARYVIDGGRILVADDFGQSDAILRRLEISRLSPGIANLPHDDYYDDNPVMPRFKPRGRHPLLERVDLSLIHI